MEIDNVCAHRGGSCHRFDIYNITENDRLILERESPCEIKIGVYDNPFENKSAEVTLLHKVGGGIKLRVDRVWARFYTGQKDDLCSLCSKPRPAAGTDKEAK